MKPADLSLFSRREELFRLLIHRRIPASFVELDLSPLVQMSVEDIIRIDFDWLTGSITVHLTKLGRSRSFQHGTNLNEIADVIVGVYEELIKE